MQVQVPRVSAKVVEETSGTLQQETPERRKPLQLHTVIAS